MGHDPFDPEDFLNLGTAKPERAARELPPIVQPPVYPRRQPAAAPRVTAPERAAPPLRAAEPRVPEARAPEAPRSTESAEEGIAARLTAPDPVLQPLSAIRPAVRPLANQPQAEAPRAPVEHYIPGYGFQRQAAAIAAGLDTGYDHAIAGPVYRRPGGAQAVAAQPAALETRFQASLPEPGFEPEQEAAYPGAMSAPSQAEQAAFRHTVPPAAPRGASLQDWENDAAEARGASRQPAVPRRPAPQRGPGLVREPMAVAFRGIEYATQTWSVYGFTLAAPLPGAEEAPISEVTLMIARGVTRLVLQVQIAAETDPGVRPARYAFIDLEPGQAEVLRRIAEHALANQARALAEMFEETDAVLAPPAPLPPVRPHYAAPPAAAQAAPTAQEDEAWPYPSPILQPKPKSQTAPTAPLAEAPKAAPRKPRNGFAIGLRLSLALAALVAGGVYWNAQSSIASRFGAVTVAATELTAPEAGFVTDLSVMEGRAVALGEVLGTIRQTDIDFSQTETGRRRQALLAEQARLSAERETLRERAVQAALGETEGEAQENARALDAADLRLSVIAAELAAMPVPPGEGQPGAPILSPCDCTVLTLNHHNGDWVEPDMPLAVLTAGEVAVVHALLLGNEARDVAVGNHARIRLADGTALAGTVERVSADPHWPGYAGLDDNVFAAGRYARVEIRPERPLTAPVGTGAEVTVQSSQIWGALRALVGI